MAAFPCSSSSSDNDHSVHHQQPFFLISDSSVIAPKITSINSMSGPFQQQTLSRNPILISPNSTYSPHSTRPSSLGLEAMKAMETKNVTVKKDESICKGKKKKLQAKHAKQKMIEKKRVSTEAQTQAASTDYVHVRARRGQATDSHSLAERARREKISQRMKFLQSLVPGCDKINGKALVLDEIINYIQSLQNQVETLAAKLASVYPLFSFLEVELDSNKLKTERHYTSLDPTMPPSSDTNFQLGSIADKMTARSSNSFSFQNEEGSTVPIAKDDEDLLLWDVEDQKMEMASLYGLDCFGSIIA